MEPISTISAAIALAEATGLSSWLGRKLGGDIGEKAAETITDVAEAVTGSKDPAEILEKIRTDKELAQKLKQTLIDNEQELKLAYLDDIKSAREMYASTGHQQADKIADGIFKWNGLLVFLLIAINVLVVVYVPNATTVALISNLIGGSIAYLWNERSQVIGFFYGSSQGSKDKSKELMIQTTKLKSLK